MVSVVPAVIERTTVFWLAHISCTNNFPMYRLFLAVECGTRNRRSPSSNPLCYHSEANFVMEMADKHRSMWP